MSTLIIGPNDHLTERHDALLSMLFQWSTTASIAIAVIRQGLVTEQELGAIASLVRAVGQGKAKMSEKDAANLLLAIFLTSRTVRRMIAKEESKVQQLRRGSIMVGLGQLRTELEEIAGVGHA